MWTQGNQLHTDDQRHVLGAFQFRMTVEAKRRWPSTCEMMLTHGYRMPERTDREWLATYVFRTRRDGRLDRRYRYTQPKAVMPTIGD